MGPDPEEKEDERRSSGVLRHAVNAETLLIAVSRGYVSGPPTCGQTDRLDTTSLLNPQWPDRWTEGLLRIHW